MTIYHGTFDLDALIHRGEAKKMAGHIRLPGEQNWATEPEIIAYAAILKAKGFEVIPVCDHHNSKGECMGHEK
jgi:hypothetical protein